MRIIKNKAMYRFIFLILAVLMTWNILWVANYNKYLKLSEGYKKYYKTMGKQIENYNCTLKCPNYFSFQGNFAISNDNLSIIIWPDLFINGNYKFGLRIFDEKLNHGYLFYVDNQLNYLDIPENHFSDDEVKVIKEILNKNMAQLEKMNYIAKREWGI